MSTPQFSQYREQTLAFVKTLTVKSVASCTGINNHMNALGYTLSDDPYTWRYYLNLAGLYHTLDIPMTVTSLDTLELVEFTQAALEEHVMTRAAYTAGSPEYRTLVTLYPSQELLIRGIIHPVDLTTAVEAEDHTILFYEKSLIESNETNVISNLQRKITGYFARWDNPSYAVVDDLYVTAYLGVLYLQLPGWLYNIRLANCKTGYVHSFHIREYLKSHGRLDRYFDYLTRSQALFLYRNLVYIENNAGKTDTFEWLVKKLLTDRSIGLAEYRLHHDLTDLLTDLKPKPEFTRHPLNRFHRSALIEEHSFSNLLFKERPLAVKNLEVETETLVNDSQRIVNARRATFPTKVLESAIIDWSESGVLLRTLFLFNHWLYWSTTGKYRALIRVYHPQTNGLIELTPKDAMILYLYAYNASIGITLTDIPTLTAQAIRREPTPSKETLAKLLTKSPLKETVLNAASQSHFLDTPILSPFQFVKTVDTLFRTFYRHREIYAVQEHSRYRAEYQAVLDHLYQDVNTVLTESNEPQTYNDWFNSKSLSFENWSVLEAESLSKDLFTQATGIDLVGTYSPSDIQRAMVGLMQQLSSYSIQFVKEVNPGPIVFWEWPATRLGQLEGGGTGYYRLKLLSKNFNGVETIGTSHEPWLVNRHPLQFHFHGVDKVYWIQKPPEDARGIAVDHLRLPVSRVYFNRVTDIEMV